VSAAAWAGTITSCSGITGAGGPGSIAWSGAGTLGANISQESAGAAPSAGVATVAAPADERMIAAGTVGSAIAGGVVVFCGAGFAVAGTAVGAGRAGRLVGIVVGRTGRLAPLCSGVGLGAGSGGVVGTVGGIAIVTTT
jgi:hypothetical protein